MKVVCFGDSNTYGYDPRSFPGGRYEHPWPEILGEQTGWQVINWGENGREIPRTAVAFPEDMDLLILMLGTNDLLQFWTPAAAAEKMEHFLKEIHVSREKVLLIAPPPMVPGAWVEDQELIHDCHALAAAFLGLAGDLGVHFADAADWHIPMAHDGVHMTQEGHVAFAGGLWHDFFLNQHCIRPAQQEVDMIPCVSVENMRLSDAYTIENFVPGPELMHRAAMGVFRAVSWSGSIAIVAGSGNNGGDGFALACILKEAGFACTVFTVSEKLSPDSAFYAQKAKHALIPILPYAQGCLDGFSILVDCLLGTGFQGIVRGNYRTAIEEINNSHAYVVSVDINSGMNGDTGEAELAVFSDLTVTIGYVKNGLVAPGAGKYMKKLVCADIGILLVREEGRITKQTCPSWLDMQILDART